MPDGNKLLEFQREEILIMEERDSATSSRRKSNDSNDRGEDDAPSFDFDGSSPTRFNEHASILSEVYGFIATITAMVGVGILIIWAYVPEQWLEFVGIHYYPNRYLELDVPSYVTVMIVLAIVLYTGLNFLATPPPTSLKSVFDEYGEDLLSLGGVPLTDDGEPADEPASDITVDRVSEMLNDLKSGTIPESCIIH